MDHAYALAVAIADYVPWLEHCDGAGVQPIYVAGSQNGWERPTGESESLQLSKRTRLRIRVEKSKVKALSDQLVGQTLTVNGNSLEVISAELRPLRPSSTLFSRQVIFSKDAASDSEPDFIEKIMKRCRLLDFEPTKIICGKHHQLMTNSGPIATRSVLLADVPDQHSLKLQDRGIGDGRLFGCGLLIPHKDTSAVGSSSAG